MPSEKTVEKKIKMLVRVSGGFCTKVHADAIQGKGTIDLLGGYKGKPFYVEVKRSDGGEVAPLQRRTVLLAKRGGYITGTVSSVEEFEELFR